MDSCIFCQIVAKKLPAKIVSETDHLLAFPTITPETDVHFLIIPKEHINGVQDLTENHGPLLAEIYQMANELVKEYNLEDDLYRIRVNGGKAQHVKHIHFHLLGGEYKK